MTSKLLNMTSNPFFPMGFRTDASAKLAGVTGLSYEVFFVHNLKYDMQTHSFCAAAHYKKTSSVDYSLKEGDTLALQLE